MQLFLRQGKAIRQRLGSEPDPGRCGWSGSGAGPLRIGLLFAAPRTLPCPGTQIRLPKKTGLRAGDEERPTLAWRQYPLEEE